VFGRLSLSVGVRRSLAAGPESRSSVAGGGRAPAARLKRRAVAVVAAQASEEVCGASGRAATSLGRCQSAAATHSLTASAGARWPLRLLPSTHAFQRRLSSNVYAVSHGARCPKRVSLYLSLLACLGRAQIEAPVPPHTRPSRTHRSTLEAQGSASLTRHATGRRAPAYKNKPPHRPRRRRDDSEQTTYKQEG